MKLSSSVYTSESNTRTKDRVLRAMGRRTNVAALKLLVRPPIRFELERYSFVLTIQENLRMHNVVSGVQRQTVERVELPSGYSIPANQSVFVAFSLVHYNEEIWPEPHKFKPER